MEGFRKAVKEVGDAGDKLFTSNEEKMELVNNRHRSDMDSDSWLSKNIRPLAFIFVLLTLTGMIIADGFNVSFNQNTFELVGKLAGLSFGFYFGGRSLEKITNRIFNRDKEKKGAF